MGAAGDDDPDCGGEVELDPRALEPQRATEKRTSVIFCQSLTSARAAPFTRTGR